MKKLLEITDEDLKSTPTGVLALLSVMKEEMTAIKKRIEELEPSLKHVISERAISATKDKLDCNINDSDEQRKYNTTPYCDLDSGLLSLFNAHVNMLNVEKQLIWQRYHAVLFANSIMIVFVTSSNMNHTHKLIFCILGLLLCFAWRRMALEGWRLQDIRIKAGQSFSWETFPSPLLLQHHQEMNENKRKHSILFYAKLVIFIFVITYFSLAIDIIIRDVNKIIY